MSSVRTVTMKLSRSGGSFPLVDRKYASVPIAPPHPTKKSRHSTNPAMNTLSITSCVSAGITWGYSSYTGNMKSRPRSCTREEAFLFNERHERRLSGTATWAGESQQWVSTREEAASRKEA